tara:strand:- start:16857 stop:17420 length:564 start_codon:yes stop_codon:yes gene_type:complete
MSVANPTEIGPRDLRAAYNLDAGQAKALEFLWRGNVQESTTAFVLEWMEHRLNELKAESLQKKRILRVAIEILQNLHHHAQSPHESISFEVVTNHSSTWWIRSENAITSEQESYLQQTLNALSAAHPDLLRTMQRDKIAHQERSEHGGGGVGLNELIRKSLGQVYVEFTSYNDFERRVVFITKLELK